MNVRELEIGKSLRPMKIPAREVPHAVIEPNYTCNRRCALCYNRYKDVVKPFEQVVEEIDQLLQKRNLETISILGGEPTLHPSLPAIVRAVRSRNVCCQILTNGVVLMKDHGDRLLDKLVEAGLNRIILHVDCGQGLTDDEIDEICDTLFPKFEARKLYFGLSMTLYVQNYKTVPAIMRRYAHFRYFDGILGTVARSADAASGASITSDGEVTLTGIHRAIRGGLQVDPASYIPSSLDDSEIRWLIYFYYLNVLTGTTVAMSPAVSRLFRRIYRLLEGKHLFAATVNASYQRLSVVVTALAEVLAHPGRAPEFLRLFWKSAMLRQLRFHYIVLQSAPTPGDGPFEICYHCPDATIRDGKLVPVCLADRVSPPGRHVANGPRDTELGERLHEHLEAA